jgi:hypothetical protein
VFVVTFYFLSGVLRDLLFTERFVLINDVFALPVASPAASLA